MKQISHAQIAILKGRQIKLIISLQNKLKMTLKMTFLIMLKVDQIIGQFMEIIQNQENQF